MDIRKKRNFILEQDEFWHLHKFIDLRESKITKKEVAVFSPT